jgi:RHS repeat-associated protein
VFGEPVAEGGTAVGQPFGFTGREHEVESGLVYARHRFLQAGTGTWTQADRFVAAHDKAWDVTSIANLHLYGFVGQSPTGFVDPLGQIRIPTTVEAFIFRMIVRGAYQEAVIAMQALGMNAMMRGQAVQQALSRWLASGAARLFPATGGAGYRVADFLDTERNLLVELKFMDACNFRIQAQITDMANWAQQNGYRMVLVIRNSELMKPGVAVRLQQLQVQVIELKDWAMELVEAVPLGGA